MFQFGFSVSTEFAGWFDEISEVFGIRIKKAGGVAVSVRTPYRVFVSVACENGRRAALLRETRECLADMYATVVKSEYLKGAIRLPIDAGANELLLHTFVAFDRDNEREIIEKAMPLCDGMTLDGVFRFRLRELTERWDEISRLATENAMYLTDEDTRTELIRFLIGAVSPKVRRLDVSQREGDFRVCGRLPESEFEYHVETTDQLLLYLIDLAPLEVRLDGDFTDLRLCERLERIFDAKRVENSPVWGR